MAGSRAQQAAIAISMKKAGKVPKGYHKMPDGKIMKDSVHKMKYQDGGFKTIKKQIKEDVKSRTKDLNTLTNNPIEKLKNKIIGAKAIKTKIKEVKKTGEYDRRQESIEPERYAKLKTGGSTPAWQRKEGKSPSGGLNAKGRASLKAAGHDIKAPQPEGGPRKRSFCARMSGMKKKLTSAKTANDPNSRINKSLRKWKC